MGWSGKDNEPHLASAGGHFLLGVVAARYLLEGLLFLRFWKSTRGYLFLAFSVFFAPQGGSSCFIVRLSHPNEGSLWIGLVRL